MIKLFFLTLLAIIVFVVISVMSGGKEFRNLGEMFHKGADKAADSADRMKNIVDRTGKAIERTSDRINNATENAAKSLKETKEIINEKAEDISKRTEDKAHDLKKGINNSITNSIDSIKAIKDKNAGTDSDHKDK